MSIEVSSQAVNISGAMARNGSNLVNTTGLKRCSGDGKNYQKVDLGMNNAERGQDLRLEW